MRAHRLACGWQVSCTEVSFLECVVVWGICVCLMLFPVLEDLHAGLWWIWAAEWKTHLICVESLEPACSGHPGILVCSSLFRGGERVLWKSNFRGDVILVSAEGCCTELNGRLWGRWRELGLCHVCAWWWGWCRHLDSVLIKQEKKVKEEEKRQGGKGKGYEG